MSIADQPAVFVETEKGYEFNYNKEYAKALSVVVGDKLAAIEKTTTSAVAIDPKFQDSVSWSLLHKLVALSTRFAQFNSFPKVSSALIGEIQFPSVTFETNGTLTLLKDGSGVLGSVVDKVAEHLKLLNNYHALAEQSVVAVSSSQARYDEHFAVLTAIEKLLKDLAGDGTHMPKTFQNLKLKIERHDYRDEGGPLVVNLTVDL